MQVISSKVIFSHALMNNVFKDFIFNMNFSVNLNSSNERYSKILKLFILIKFSGFISGL